MKLVTLIVVALFFVCNINSQETKNNLSIEEFVYDENDSLKIYCVRPENFSPDKKYPAIVIFHGGGWSIGEASWGFSNAKHYASLGMVAFSVQYRLQDLEKGITPYESVLDAQKAIRWIRNNKTQFSIDENKIASYGWSAGAHLATCASVFNNLNAADAKTSSAPNLLLLKSPALSLMLYPNFQKRLLNKIKVENISPAEFVSSKTPPTLIVIGREDTVTPISGSELYKQNMDKHGNECEMIVYENVGHLFTPATEPDNGWPNPDKKVSKDAQQKMDDFLRKHKYIKTAN